MKNLYQSFHDRERVPKIQGLLNECMTFLDDELSVITGPYEDLLSIDEVIDQELILLVTLNVNKNTEPVRALGKMLLQNLQLVVGKRYESEEQRRQSRPADVQRRPRRVRAIRIPELRPDPPDRARDEHRLPLLHAVAATAHAGRPRLQGGGDFSAEHDHDAAHAGRRNGPVLPPRFGGTPGHEAEPDGRALEAVRVREVRGHGRAVESEDRETRALDEHIKNLPKGQMEILMTDDTRGTLHTLLHVRPPADVTIPNFEPELYPRLHHSRADSVGANLRFKSSSPAATTRFTRRAAGGSRT